MYYAPLRIRALTLTAILVIFILMPAASFAGTPKKPRISVLRNGPDLLIQRLTFFLKYHDLKSVDEYAAWLKNHVSYRTDGKHDTWTPPMQTLRRNYGDCEDFAFLNSVVLEILQHQSKILLLFKPGNAHAICIFKQDGLISLFDNNQLVQTAFHSQEELISHLKKKNRYKAVQVMDYKDRPWTSRGIPGVLVSAEALGN